MPRFSIRNPYFIVVICLALAVIGVNAFSRMPVDLFPAINLAGSGGGDLLTAACRREDIETDITNPLERFFTLASGIDHMESRSLLGVSIIKVFFQPGTNADADVTQLSNLALADLKRLPPGTLAAGGAEVRCLQPARLPGDGEGRGPERNPASRSRPVPDPQSDRGGEGRGNPRRVRRQVPAGDGLCRSLQAALAPAERDGRGRTRSTTAI